MEQTRSRFIGPPLTPRTAVIWSVLRAELERRGDDELTVLDVGGGTGGFAVPLAHAGHRVTVVDASPDALAALTRRAAEAGVGDRVHAVQGDGDALGGLVEPASVDLVLCHAVLEVVDDPAPVVEALVTALRPGGAASVLVAGRAAAVLGRAMNGHLSAAATLAADPAGAAGPRDTLRRRYDADTAAALLRAAGLAVEETHGVRVLADLLPAAVADGAPAALLELELALAARPPYRDLAAQLHLFARRPASEPEPEPAVDRSTWRTGAASAPPLAVGMTGLLEPVAPRYGGGSLADVLPSALAVLGVPGSPDPLGLTADLDGVRRIAVLLVDGLGWHQIPTARPYAPTLFGLTSLLGRRLTAGFPSTTPTSLVSLGTGVAPGAHGVVGFKLRVPGTDRLLSHIEWTDEPDPRRWQPVPTQLERARAAGVAVTVVSRPEYAGSGLTVAANRGGDYRGAATGDALATELLAALSAGDGPTLVSGYHPDLDRQGHLHGVDSDPWRIAVTEVDGLLARLVDGLPDDAALLVTADHGQLNIPDERRVDLDADARLRDGVRVVAGEPRVRYLHVAPGARADVVATWQALLGDAARVLTREEAVATGWFGPVPEEHLARIGDVVAVCRDDWAVVATRSERPIESRLVAYHGADTATEMTIPLLVVRG